MREKERGGGQCGEEPLEGSPLEWGPPLEGPFFGEGKRIFPFEDVSLGESPPYREDLLGEVNTGPSWRQCLWRGSPRRGIRSSPIWRCPPERGQRGRRGSLLERSTWERETEDVSHLETSNGKVGRSPHPGRSPLAREVPALEKWPMASPWRDGRTSPFGDVPVGAAHSGPHLDTSPCER